jgi:hypothetical protein
MSLSKFLPRILVVAALILGSCTEKRMAKKQVESILGQPTSETKDSQNRTTAYVYKQGKDLVTIVFKDDKVQSRQSTLSE